ncbi:MAG: hypothetical protein IK144_03025 [Bacteroidaceae bacterium]|nr:hypothetical protein [Bacteroidaceae bacterium]
MKKILFLHGFFASGQCVPAMALREAFEGRAEVLRPDLPMHPKEAVRLIRELCENEKPDVLVGNSCGSFYAQMIAPALGIPALLGNPHFQMTDFLRTRIGAHQYKSPRKNGIQDFIIDEQLILEFAEMQEHQFDRCTLYGKEHVWGLFGEQDTLAHFEPLFLEYYAHSYHFPGGHTPTADEVRTWYVPLIERMLSYGHDY